MFFERNKTMMMQNYRTVRQSVDATSKLEKERKALHQGMKLN
jgi:hypothetical protein